ncbi:hypothetical protein [Nocardioides sp.]|uniref:hypothetical protein n=1 Tax=Nocardioides sp. TaxID=35761 RepID=UPI0026301AA4|nr:hypothetical protein [Nocardioides sp.]
MAGGVAAVEPTRPAAAEEASGWSIPAMQSAAVPLAQAGELVAWGLSDSGQLPLPAAMRDVAIVQTVDVGGVILALTASGTVLAAGGNPAGVSRIPARVNEIGAVQLTGSDGSYAGAILKDGTVAVWGINWGGSDPLDVPAGLRDVKQLLIVGFVAFALKTDGSVVVWGAPASTTTTTAALWAVPTGLRATALSGGADMVSALTADGTVVSWGFRGDYNPPPEFVPPEVTESGNVTAVSRFGDGALALLKDGSVVPWGSAYRTAGGDLLPWLPPSMTGHAIVAFKQEYGSVMAVDEVGSLHLWRTGGFAGPQDWADVPSDALAGKHIAQFDVGMSNAMVIVTKMLSAVPPSVTGAVVAGRTVTGVPGTFSASPTSVSSQWYVNGVASGNTSPTLNLTGLQGKTIAYVSTAEKAGETTVTSTSTPVTVAPAPKPPVVAKVAASIKVTSLKVAKKGAKVSIAGKVVAAKAPTGAVTLTVSKGPKRVVTTTLRVPASGALSVTIAKFSKLALKAVKGKSKKRYRGTYALVIAYGGNSLVKPASARATFRVK